MPAAPPAVKHAAVSWIARVPLLTPAEAAELSRATPADVARALADHGWPYLGSG
ncbi:MAG: hypothetical protein OXC71_08960 [Chloroflexi bacterium]|nr:hypothetical protein [Chloroflexota bacterium]